MLASRDEYYGIHPDLRIQYEAVLQATVDTLYDHAVKIAGHVGLRNSFDGYSFTIYIDPTGRDKQKFTQLRLVDHSGGWWSVMQWGNLYPKLCSERVDLRIFSQHEAKPHKKVQWRHLEAKCYDAAIYFDGCKIPRSDGPATWGSSPHRIDLRCPLLYHMRAALLELEGKDLRRHL